MFIRPPRPRLLVRALVLAPMMAALTAGAAMAASDDAAPPSAARPADAAMTGALDAEDAEIAGWLRNLIENDLYQYVPRKENRPDIEAFYRNRNFAPVWIRNGAVLPAVRDALDVLRDAGADGLEPSDYPRPYFPGGSFRLAADEMIFTNSVVTFARHARIGVVGPARLGAQVKYDLPDPKPSEFLGRLADAADVRAVLESLLPQNPEYKALRAVLASERTRSVARAGSAPSRTRPLDTLIANMERWRWLPRDLGAAYVMVNVPGHTLKVVDRGKTLWSTRIVVGKAGASATPLFSEAMTRIVVNPADAPGGRAGSGHIRFDIPGSVLVTQADAPANLLGKNERVHGRPTILVEDAERYAQVLLSIARPDDGITVENIRGMYGDSEQSIQFKNAIPVHVTYQTAFVDDAGQLQIQPDIYGYDRDIVSLMRSDRISANGPERNRTVADGPSTYNRETIDRPAVRRTVRSPFAFPWD